jgi:hypothetical protein
MKLKLDRHNPFEAQADSTSAEFSPTSHEIEQNLELVETMDQQLYDIEAELRDPGHFDYGAEYNERRVMDPQDLWDQITYAWIDFGDKITDSEEKERLKRMDKALDRKILQHFIPYIASRVSSYGESQSYIASNPNYKGHARHKDRLKDDFKNAYWHIESYEMTPEDKAELQNEIDQLKNKAEEYTREPWLHKFEREEIDLWHDADSLYFYSSPYQNEEASFGVDPEQDPSLQKLDKLYEQAQKLQSLVDKMEDAEIKERSGIRAGGIMSFVERQLLNYTAPKDLLNIQGQLDDIISDLDAGAGEAVAIRLDAVKAKLDSLSGLETASKSIRDIYNKIKNKYKRALRQKNGETFEADETLETNFGNPDWALGVLGLDLDANPGTIKQAYKNLVRKNHPDLFQDEAKKVTQTKIMQKINEAFMFLRNMGKLEEES